jgi:hypothetical protein
VRRRVPALQGSISQLAKHEGNRVEKVSGTFFSFSPEDFRCAVEKVSAWKRCREPFSPVELDVDHASEIHDLASLETRGLPLPPSPPARDRVPG